MIEANRKHILVVDDDASYRLAVAAVLNEAGYAATTAWSGYEALNLMRVRPFDLVMLGDNLPDVGRPEMLREMQIMSLDLPVVVMVEESSGKPARSNSSTQAFKVMSKTMNGSDISSLMEEVFESCALEAVSA